MSTANKIAVSACLAGVPCRYDGKSQKHPAVMLLVAQKKAILLCPERAGGLPTPRPPAEIVNGQVLTKDGQDLTHEFEQGAQKCVDKALEAGCTAAVLQPRSPSCGVHQIYDGTFCGKLIAGSGFFAALCRQHGLQLMEPDEL